MKIKTIQDTIETLSKIPGISKKQAEKMSWYFINQGQDETKKVINSLNNICQNIKYCENCNFIKENEKCLNCDDILKTNSLMIVESPTTLNKIDDLGIFHGHYYVLPYLMKLKNKFESEDYDYPGLVEYIKQHQFEEVIVVISPSLEGEITTTKLLNLIQNLNIKVSRAAIGIPMGANLDYLDAFTIKQAINNRNNKG